MAIGVQVTFDAHDPGRLAAFWGEAQAGDTRLAVANVRR